MSSWINDEHGALVNLDHILFFDVDSYKPHQWWVVARTVSDGRFVIRRCDSETEAKALVREIAEVLGPKATVVR